ncbi:hypothetical protein RQP46_002542 [Phenoliferia psychrophenolica]
MSYTPEPDHTTVADSTRSSVFDDHATLDGGDHRSDIHMDDLSKAKKAQQPNKQIFSEPGTMPLPKSGFHSLGVCYEGLTVIASGQTKRTVETAERSFLQSWNLPSYLMKLAGYKYTKTTRELISDFSGVVPPGETMLVLGRPGSGCSTLLRAIANERGAFIKVEGNVQYSTIDASEAGKYYNGEIVFNNEEDAHYPILSVAQTLAVAHKLKKPANMQHPQHTKEYALDQTNRALTAFGMTHVVNTKVGNDYIRGVSGGERKRVSLSEMFSTNAALICWDNCIRGLDSAVALHFLRMLKEMARSTGQTSIVSIYQASQETYDTCFDRVTVIYEGKMVFCGHVEDAAPYFIEQGWYKKARQTVPDFLTACTSVSERQVREDFRGTVPETPEEMAAYFRASPMFTKLQNEIAQYKATEQASNHAEEFRLAVAKSKHKGAGKANPYKANFAQQIGVLVVRQVQLVIAAPTTFLIRLGSNVLQSLIVGAIFYKPASDATGSFMVAGGLYFTVLYFAIFSLAEIPPTIGGRPLLIKHRKLGFYTPAAKIFAEMVVDAPVFAFQTLIFASLFYFLLGLSPTASVFFTFFFIIYSCYMAISVLNRMVGTWSPNLTVGLRYGGLNLLIILIAGDFMLPPPFQHRWISWTRRISPVAYAFEINVKFQFLEGNIWRNVGILWAMYAFYAFMVVLGSTIIIKDTGGNSGTLFKPNATIPLAAKKVVTRNSEAEKGAGGKRPGFLFTFKNVFYTVKVGGKDRVLLDNVSGIVESGGLTALMGASGAGKTTLLNTIAGRQTTGVVEGEMLLDGKPLGETFSRCTGFAQQGDVHDAHATVRECLQFSALLRQTGNRTREEKLAYAEEVIDLLELGPIADALIGNAEIGGLGVENRKRVTIGVELAARPDSLLFLDEPTSGLDSQAAFDICRFLRKIAATQGLAICAVIHQPSGDLFEMFDSIVLLAPGGKTVYAGATGPDSSVVSAYFAKFDAAPDASANPAEHLIATVAPVGGSKIDWPGRWNASPEAAALQARIAEAAANPGGNIPDEKGAFASTFKEQVYELVIRNTRSQYRDGAYFTSILMLSCFYSVIQCAAPISFETAHYYFEMYLARERNGIYSWPALVTALLLVEIPILIVCFTLAFLCFYWTAGLESTAQTAGLQGSISPSSFSIGLILSLLWNVINALSWALVPWPSMPQPFHSFFSFISPLRWFFGALMESSLSPMKVTCAASEVSYFNIPSGQTCQAFAAEFMKTAAGYLTNPDGSGSCGYCQMSTGADYIAQLGYSFDHRWRDWGIFIVMCTSNVMVAFAFTWILRIRPLYSK